jgi:hypothetical protein
MNKLCKIKFFFFEMMLVKSSFIFKIKCLIYLFNLKKNDFKRKHTKFDKIPL